MVYFISAEDTNLVKIGYSKDPIKRLAVLQHMSPIKVGFLKIVRGDRQKEHEIHVKLQDCRSHGEWFRFTSKLLKIMKSYGEANIIYQRAVPDIHYKTFNELINIEGEGGHGGSFFGRNQ